MDLYNASSSGYIESPDDEAPKELTLEEFEQAKKEYQAILDVAQAARRLSENPDFKMVVMDRYFEHEPTRLANLMASGKVHETTLNNCAKELEAIGKFRSFLTFTLEQGNIAADDLAGLEQAWDEHMQSQAN
jgi:hypothetical protein